MGEHSEGKPESGAPVFVDSSGGRRRMWRRLGLAMGVAGGGYALVVAVSVIGGNSEAPWGVLTPGADDGATKVVPDQDESQTTAPWADAARPGEPSPGASPSGSAAGTGRAPTPETSSGPSPTPSGSSAADTATSKSSGGTRGGGTGTGNKGGTTGSPDGTGSTGGTGGPAPSGPSTEPTGGGATGSNGAPADPGPTPSESSGTSEPSLLEAFLGTLGGTTGAAAAGAE